MSADRVVLWHLAMSHYNEKARWALEYKGVPHARRAVMPGLHQLVARRLGGGLTMPLLTIGDEVFPDSTEIVAAIEQRWPEPPLYPDDPDERADALALEDRLDEILAPAVRQLVYQRILDDPDGAAAFLAFGGPPSRLRLVRRAIPLLGAAIKSNFDVPPRDDTGPADTILEFADELAGRLADRPFLTGDAFTVADLSACAYLMPLINIEAMAAPAPLPPRFGDVRAELAESPVSAWIERTYLDHRFTNAPAAHAMA
ncbi:MAG: glutathione S-transferase family protein [Baekduia sp.]